MKPNDTATVCRTLIALGIGMIGIANLVAPANASILWDENTQSDLSNDRLNPTILPSLMQGDNLLSIILENPTTLPQPQNRDLDFFVVNVPSKLALSQLILTQYGGGTSDDVAFIALQEGTVFTEPVQPPSVNDPMSGTTNPANLFGYALIGDKTTYGPSTGCDALGLTGTPLPPGAVVQVGENLLPILGDGSNNRPDALQPNSCLSFPSPIGFTAPLTAGNYVFWVQQTVAGDTQLQLNFIATSVPEPTSVLALITFGMLGLGLTKQKH